MRAAHEAEADDGDAHNRAIYHSPGALAVDGRRIQTVSIKSTSEFENMRVIGHIVAKTLRAMKEGVRPGITTGELNQIGAHVLAENGVRSAPPLVYGSPAEVSISINDEAIDGIPGGRVIEAGDPVNWIWLRKGMASTPTQPSPCWCRRYRGVAATWSGARKGHSGGDSAWREPAIGYARSAAR
jgi:hypothetical protein